MSLDSEKLRNNQFVEKWFIAYKYCACASSINSFHSQVQAEITVIYLIH